jgi:hypothetical protein
VTPILISHRGLATLGFRTSFADFDIACDAPWPGFDASAGVPWPTDLPEIDPDRAEVVAARGWLGQRERGFVAIHYGNSTRVTDDARSLCFECIEGRALRWRHAPTDEALAIETLLGAGLVLAFSRHERFCLHASAVRTAQGVWLFLGNSGAGKSTLARELAAVPGVERVADDIVPVRCLDNGVDALPRFPQLKLDAAQWWPARQPAALPICAIASIERADDAQITVLAPGAAQQALIAHTAGARLFDTALLAQHLAWCAALARRVPCVRLTVPHRPNDVRGAARAVADRLRAAATHCEARS